MRNLKRIGCAAAAAVLMALSSGCGEFTGLDAQTLMAPPRSTADREAVFALMRGEEDDVSLVYPKNGDYRSAVISRDLDGDGANEVVGFSLNGDTAGISVQVLSKTDGTWHALARFTNAASQVDKVLFGDLTGDGTEEIIVGWGDPFTMTASVSVYQMEGGAVRELPMSAATYNEMLLTDFDDDARAELFVMNFATSTVSEGAEEGTTVQALGQLYRFDGDQPYVAQTVPLDSAVTRYTAASFAQVNSWRRCAVIDGVRADGRLVTQVVGFDSVSEQLTAPLSAGENATDRAAAVSITARDVNGDGIVEIPTASLIEAAPEGTAADSTAYVVTWNTYSLGDNVFTPVAESVVNVTENYMVVLPESGIACTNDSVTRTATFYSYTKSSDGAVQRTGNLFSVTTYSDDGWSADTAEEDELYLTGMGGRVYVLKVLGSRLTTESEFIRSVQQSFRLLSE